MENKNQNDFHFTYSAQEKEEIQKIRQKYVREAKNNEDGIARLRHLDSHATQKSQTVSLIFGIIGVLILGFGMSLIMSELGALLGLFGTTVMIVGIASGLVGGVLVCLAYPMYQITLKKERAKVAPEILKLTEELMK